MRGMMWLMALGGGIMLSSSGCCGFLRDGSCGRGCGCESCGGCEGDCGQIYGPVRHPRRVYADDCGECASCGTHAHCGACESCGECGDECGGCCQRNFCFHPLRWFGKLFYAGTWCGPCCGNTYWGECVNDPPACHEPCNHDGHWTGRSGCSSCNHGGMQESGNMSPSPDAGPGQDEPSMQPTPAVSARPKATRRAAADNYER
jgi:hypothetical protein